MPRYEELNTSTSMSLPRPYSLDMSGGYQYGVFHHFGFIHQVTCLMLSLFFDSAVDGADTMTACLGCTTVSLRVQVGTEWKNHPGSTTAMLALTPAPPVQATGAAGHVFPPGHDCPTCSPFWQSDTPLHTVTLESVRVQVDDVAPTAGRQGSTRLWYPLQNGRTAERPVFETPDAMMRPEANMNNRRLLSQHDGPAAGSVRMLIVMELRGLTSVVFNAASASQQHLHNLTEVAATAIRFPISQHLACGTPTTGRGCTGLDLHNASFHHPVASSGYSSSIGYTSSYTSSYASSSAGQAGGPFMSASFFVDVRCPLPVNATQTVSSHLTNSSLSDAVRGIGGVLSHVTSIAVLQTNVTDNCYAPTAVPTPAPTMPARVEAAVVLLGISVDQFNATAQLNFRTTVASASGSVCGPAGAYFNETRSCLESDVIITSSVRRDVSVSFYVVTATWEESIVLAARLSPYVNSQNFTSDLVAQGGALGAVSGTTVSSAPTALYPPPPTPVPTPTPTLIVLSNDTVITGNQTPAPTPINIPGPVVYPGPAPVPLPAYYVAAGPDFLPVANYFVTPRNGNILARYDGYHLPVCSRQNVIAPTRLDPVLPPEPPPAPPPPPIPTLECWDGTVCPGRAETPGVQCCSSPVMAGEFCAQIFVCDKARSCTGPRACYQAYESVWDVNNNGWQLAGIVAFIIVMMVFLTIFCLYCFCDRCATACHLLPRSSWYSHDASLRRCIFNRRKYAAQRERKKYLKALPQMSAMEAG